MIEQEAAEFIELLKERYFINRDMETLLQLMDDSISWIGSGEREISNNLNEARQALSMESNELEGSFQVKKCEYKIIKLSEHYCAAYGSIDALPEDMKIAEERLRFTLLLEKKETGMKLLHLHFSHPDYSQEEGHSFISKAVWSDNRSLRSVLNARARQLENLTKNIPGGVHQCLNDSFFTLLSLSDSFLSMLGYTRKEIRDLFNNKYINMIYIEDREEVLKKTKQQLEQGIDVELEYRVRHKNGELIWILDKGRLLEDGNGETCFYCLILDITERKQEQEELRLSLERHQVIIDQATDIIFEWDIRKDTLTFSPNWYKKFGYDPIKTNISEGIPDSRDIHSEDMLSFIKIMKDTREGTPYSEAEFRIRNAEGQYLWCRIRATAQYDAEGNTIKAVGVITDINTEKKQKEELIELAQKDALTGLYNKTTVNRLVEQLVMGRKPYSFQALMIIDIDHFKMVNDLYGHLCGDGLLSDVAAVLKSHIRSSDLAGRIGGDEFLIYLPEVKDKNAARRKAEELRSALEILTPAQGAPPIGCSIGIAFFPMGEIDYRTLYKFADQALYYQKNHGRSGVSFYDCKHCDDRNQNQFSAVGAVIGSEYSNAASERLAQYAFHVLYEAVDIEVAINRLLEIIGRSYDVSRVYIFESLEDERYTSMKYEWCSEGIQPQISMLQNFSYQEDLGDYQKNFDEEGLFYCHDIEHIDESLRAVLAPQNIRSMLQCAIIDEGRFLGGVGFDECRENRCWDQYQILSFKLTANVLATFLIKLRLKQELKRIKNNKTIEEK